jgi:hypothetical protein
VTGPVQNVVIWIADRPTWFVYVVVVGAWLALGARNRWAKGVPRWPAGPRREALALSQRSGKLPEESTARLAHLIEVTEAADEEDPGFLLADQAASIVDSRQARFDESRKLVPSGIYVTVLVSCLLVLALITWFDIADTRLHLVVILSASLLVGLTQARSSGSTTPTRGGGPGISYQPYEPVVEDTLSSR